MDVSHHADAGVDDDLSPAKALGLVAAAIVAALLGASTLGFATAHPVKKQHAGGERSFECIVASAVFVGASREQTR